MTSVTFRDAGVVDVKFGSGVTVIRPANLYGCTIGDECFIGPFVEVQRDVGRLLGREQGWAGCTRSQAR